MHNLYEPSFESTIKMLRSRYFGFVLLSSDFDGDPLFRQNLMPDDLILPGEFYVKAHNNMSRRERRILRRGTQRYKIHIVAAWSPSSTGKPLYYFTNKNKLELVNKY